MSENNLRAQLNMVGPATMKTGYGVHFTSLARALNKKIIVSMTPRSMLGPDLVSDQEICGMISNPFNYEAPTLCIWFADTMQLFTGARRMGFPVFESDFLTGKQMYHLHHLDDIFVTSQWAKDIVIEGAERCGIVEDMPSIVIVREGFDPGIFQPKDVKENYLTLGWKRPYIQNIGKWEERKGHPQIIRVLGELASEDYQFTFVGLWNNSFQSNWRDHANHHLITNGFQQVKPGIYGKRESLIVLPDTMSTAYDVANLMSLCDFGLYPHKAEGWCLPILESMGCGCPVIATDYSGPSEYLAPGCGIRLQPDGFENIYDNVFFQNTLGQWATIDDSQVKSAVVDMLQLSSEELEAMGTCARKQASRFTWENSANIIVDYLRDDSWKSPRN